MIKKKIRRAAIANSGRRSESREKIFDFRLTRSRGFSKV
jgi:hypothetical protein